MSIASATSKSGPFPGNGATTVFTLGFACQASSDLQVVRTDPSAADTTLTLGSDYTVSLNADQVASPGGTVTLTAAPATGYFVTLLRNVQMTQGSQLPNQGGWYPKVVENALDKLTMIVQQLQEKLSRSVTLGVTQSDPTALINTITTNASAAQASAAASAGSASAAAASATLSQNQVALATTQANNAAVSAASASDAAASIKPMSDFVLMSQGVM